MSSDGKLTDSEKLFKAREYKEKGNAAYEGGEFSKAAGSYYRAILYLKGLSINSPDIFAGLTGDVAGVSQSSTPKMSVEMEDDARTLTCECHNNLAACMLKEPTPKYERIIEHCTKALEASPNNVKALFRKGMSQYALEDYEEALKTLQRAPSDPSCLKYIELCKAGIRKHDRELAERFKNMFKS
ncbi:hypothetical protein BsWGS_14703 [Bradybaena similaris]